MAIIYDLNYVNKCRYEYQKCLDLVARSRKYYEETISEEMPRSIRGRIKRHLLLKGYKFANNAATKGAIYWAKREIVALRKGALNK